MDARTPRRRGGRRKADSWVKEMEASVGPPEWRAPELRANDDGETALYGPPVDIFSFGVCMYEAVVQSAPWNEKRRDSSTERDIFERVVAGERPDIPSSTDALPAYLALLRHCWAQDPLDRPHAREVYDRLTDLLSVLSSGSDATSVDSETKMLSSDVGDSDIDIFGQSRPETGVVVSSDVRMTSGVAHEAVPVNDL